MVGFFFLKLFFSGQYLIQYMDEALGLL
jgi:hypothetical protein